MHVECRSMVDWMILCQLSTMMSDNGCRDFRVIGRPLQVHTRSSFSFTQNVVNDALDFPFTQNVVNDALVLLPRIG